MVGFILIKMARFKNITITRQFLDNNSNAIFVFGDNLQGWGHGGAAVLRDHPQSLGFITKKFPDNQDGSFYIPKEYEPVFKEELEKLVVEIEKNPNKMFYISQLGGGLANKFNIWEKVIRNNLLITLGKYNNVVFCWEKE
jgi:hypothetical protein